MENKCNCKICKRYRKYKELIQRVPEKDQAFWFQIFERLNMVEEDLSYCESITIPRLESAYKEAIEGLETSMSFFAGHPETKNRLENIINKYKVKYDR